MEISHPGRATQFASTRTRSADTSGLLAGTNLLHLDAHAEGLGIHFDELPEVHTSVGDVIEDGFGTVALILDVAYLHLQPK